MRYVCVCVSCRVVSCRVRYIPSLSTKSQYIPPLYDTLDDAHTGLQSSVELDMAQTDVITTLCEISAWFAMSINEGWRKEGVEQRVAIMDIDINR